MRRGDAIATSSTQTPGVLSAVTSRGVAAALFALLFALTYAVFVSAEPGQRADAAAFSAMTPLYEQIGQASMTLRVALPVALVGCAAAAVVVATIRGRWAAAAAVAVASGLAILLAGVLKDDLLARAYHGAYVYAENTFPSGHATMTIVATVCCLWLLPSRRGRIAAVVPLWLLAVAASVAQLTSYAHRFSDVVGGILLGGAAMAAGIAGPRFLRSPWGLAMWALLVLTAAGSIGLVSGWAAVGHSIAAGDPVAVLVFGTVAVAVAAVMMIPLGSGAFGTAASAPRRR